MLSIRKHFNRRLFLSISLIAVSQFSYGFDNQAFAQSQAMDAFERQFGDYNAATGEYYLPTLFKSLLNSIPFIGFACGKKNKPMLDSSAFASWSLTMMQV